MKRRLFRFLVFLFLVLLVLTGVMVATAWFLLDYALQPSMMSEAEAMELAEAKLPGLHSWTDSLRTAGTLRDTTIRSKDGTPLHAWYARSARSDGRTAILLHGYTSCAPAMMHLGRMYFRDMGYNILLPDLRHAGRSGGDYVGMGWPDRLDVAEWAGTAPRLFGAKTRIVVHGISMGAATTMMYSGEPTPPTVRAFIEDCGYTSVDEQFRKEIVEMFNLPAFPLVPTASLLCRYRYGWTFGQASAVEAVSRCTKPMFFIHGSADDFVPTDMVRHLYNAKPQPKTLWVAPAAGHAESYADHPEEYTQRVADFLEPYMK